MEACAVTASCALPGSAGRCVPRPAGAPCPEGEDEACPTGHCEDGVCCTTACAGTCYSCATPLPGSCLLAADNTDPRSECGGACVACFAGACAPALLLSDPKRNQGGAGCGPGEACNALGACGHANGTACAANGDCASGWCMANTCLAGLDEVVPAVSGNTRAQVHELLDTGLLSDGSPCILTRLDEHDPYIDPVTHLFPRVRRDLHLQCRTNGVWRGRSLAQFAVSSSMGGTILGKRFAHKLDVTGTPTGPVLVGTNSNTSDLGEQVAVGDCPLWARWYYGQELVAGGSRCLSRGGNWSWEADTLVAWVSAVAAPDGTLWVAAHVVFPSGEEALKLLECGAEECLEPKSLPVSDSYGFPGQLVIHDGRPLLFHLHEGLQQVEVVDGSNATPLPVGLARGCDVDQNRSSGQYDEDFPGTALRAARLGQSPSWVLAVVCEEVVGVVEYNTDTRVFGEMTLIDAYQPLGAFPFPTPGGWGVVVANILGMNAWWPDANGVLVSQEIQRVELVEVAGMALAETDRGVFELFWDQVTRRAVPMPPPPSITFPVWWKVSDILHRGNAP